MLRPLLLPILCVACCLPAACVSKTSERMAHSDGAGAPVHLEPARAWEVLLAGQVLGHVVQFRDRSGGEQHYYSVRNTWQQELGLIDDLGRFWRYRPFEDEPEWLGSGSVLEGARQILELGVRAELAEVSVTGLVEAVAERKKVHLSQG